MTSPKQPNTIKAVTSLLCLATACFYLYTSLVGFRMPLEQRGPIMAVALVLCFLMAPAGRRRRPWAFALAVLLSVISVVVVGYLVIREDVMARALTMTWSDYVVGALFLVLVLEGTRRLAGPALPLIALVALAYGRFGYLFAPPFRHPGFSPGQILVFTTLTTEGIFGMPVEVVAKIVVIFMLFSSLLHVSGGGQYFIDMPMALFGRVRGGPAKVAVVGSALFGTISGSVVANVTTTGTFTIPMMKGIGFRPALAGAVEAIASSGGQIMPPVMAAAAFIMAEIIGVSYWKVVVAAAVPAVLWYVCLFMAVDLEAAKAGLTGVPASQLPPRRQTVLRGWYLLIPIATLLYYMALQYSPWKACFYAIVALVVTSMFTAKYRLTPRRLFNGLVQGVSDMTMVTLVCGAAGVVIGIISMSGIGLEISNFLVQVSRGNLLIVALITAIASLILGMGLPTTACYLFLAVIIGPAMTKMGVNVFAAHLFLLHFGILSGITPPVCISAFAAAAIAKSRPYETGWAACKLALPIFAVPFAWVFEPALVLQRGTPLEIVAASLTAFIGVAAATSGIVGYLLHDLKPPERACLIAGGLLLIYAGAATDIIGGILLASALVYHILAHRALLRQQ